MIPRGAWIVLFLLGLSIGVTGGLQQVVLGRANYLVHEASVKQTPAPTEARLGLETSYNLTVLSTYLGLAVGLFAIVGSWRQSHRRRRDGQQGAEPQPQS